MSAFKTFEVVIPASPFGEEKRMKVRGMILAVAADKPSRLPPPFVRGLSLAPKVLCYFAFGESPQGFELLRKQALKTRFNRASQSNSTSQEFDFNRDKVSNFRSAVKEYRKRYNKLFHTSSATKRERAGFLHFCRIHGRNDYFR